MATLKKLFLGKTDFQTFEKITKFDSNIYFNDVRDSNSERIAPIIFTLIYKYNLLIIKIDVENLALILFLSLKSSVVYEPSARKSAKELLEILTVTFLIVC